MGGQQQLNQGPTGQVAKNNIEVRGGGGVAPTLAPPGLGTSLAPSPHHTHPVSTSQGHRDTPHTHTAPSPYTLGLLLWYVSGSLWLLGP